MKKDRRFSTNIVDMISNNSNRQYDTCIVTVAQKLIAGSPKESTKLPEN
jgi:hypothetical protein